MEIHNQLTHRVFPKQPRRHCVHKLFAIHNIILHTTHEFSLMLKVHIEREHVPAEQLLVVASFEPERCDLALFMQRFRQSRIFSWDRGT